MADIVASTWDQTDDDNDAASPEGAPEGMAPGGLNNVIRMMMGALKRAYVWSNNPITTGGTSTAYTLSYTVAPSALVDGMAHVVAFNATCGASPTLNINSLGATPLHYYTGTAWAVVPAGLIVSGMICPVVYNSGAGTYRILSFPSSIGTATLAGDNAFTGTNTFGEAINEAPSVDVASATTCDIGAALSNNVRITGTTTITGLGTIADGARREVVFADALILTHNATSLRLPTNANITTVAGDTATFISLGSGSWRCTNYQRDDGTPLAMTTALIPAGAVVKYGSVVDGVYATTAGTGITVDNSKPQNTEGDQIMSLAFTPTYNNSTLIIDVGASLARANTDLVTMALFQDSTASALAAVVSSVTGAYPNFVTLRWIMTSGTTSSTTFKVRAGSDTPAALYFNGTSGGAKMNGTIPSYITITEIKA